MRFKLWGCKFYISVFFAAALAVMLVVDRTGMAALTLAAIAVHELGHIAAMLPLKQMPAEFILNLGAMKMKMSGVPSFGAEMLILMSGSICNLAAAAGCWGIYRASLQPVMLWLSLTQLAVACINLMPIDGLDGGRIMYMVTERFWGARAANFISIFLGALFILALIFAGLIMVFQKTPNPSLICFAVYLAAVIIMKYKQ